MHRPDSLAGVFARERAAGVSWALFALGLAGAARAQTAADLSVPAGFEVQLFAADLGTPRGMAFGPDANLYVTLSREGRVVMLPDRNGDGQSDGALTVLENLNRPSGISFRGSDLWVAEMSRIIRVDGPMRSLPRTDFTVVVKELPAGGNWTRTLLMDPRGEGLFLAIGSSCDLCLEEDPRRGAIVRYRLDGSGEEVWASGLRNSVGLAISPETGELWATDNGRDWLGDDLPPEELNAVRRGRDYGWPFCYGARVPNPEYNDGRRCDGTEPPMISFPAHTAPLGIVFYTGAMFPEEYSLDAFVALHGSWNRSVPSGYKVVRVRIEAGRPAAVEDFVTGWLTAGGRVSGRPVQPLVGPDGALYVSDDHGGRIWRVVYVGKGVVEREESEG